MHRENLYESILFFIIIFYEEKENTNFLSIFFACCVIIHLACVCVALRSGPPFIYLFINLHVASISFLAVHEGSMAP